MYIDFNYQVDLLKQANSRLANPEILDKCLNNRVWVLKVGPIE